MNMMTMENIGELKQGLDGHRFQQELADFIVTNKFKIIVETGYGVSSVFITYAFKHSFDMNDAKLYSIDPKPWFNKTIESPQHELWKSKSEDALLPLFTRTGPWDLFLHDGCHDIKAQNYDLEFGHACLRHGGVIACDDYSWGGHRAWQEFIERHTLKELRLGDIAYAYKVSHKVLDKTNAKSFSEHTLGISAGKEAMWLLMGNKNSEAFQ